MIKPIESSNFIYVDSISYRYPDTDKYVFRDFSATFPMNSRTAVLARSGSGKTTLLHLLAGLIKPTGGTIRYPAGMGKEPSFSMVFQDNRLLEYKSVLKNVKLTAGKVTDEQIEEALKKAGIFLYRDKKVSALSGGEKRRCAIVRALLADYDILLLDEPFTALDGETKNIMMRLVDECADGKTMILVTHDESEAEFLGCSILKI